MLLVRLGKLGAATGTTPFVRGVLDHGSAAGESYDGRVCGTLRTGLSYAGGWDGVWKWSCSKAVGEDMPAIFWEAEREGAG